jgi:hypothetical protein
LLRLWLGAAISASVAAALTDSEVPAATRLASARAAIPALVDNPDLLTEYGPQSVPPSPVAPHCDYLLVTTTALRSAFQPLLEQKAAAGLAVRAEVLADILAGTPGRDAPERLRAFLCRAQAQWGVSYVLLGGDTATIPCRYAYVPMGERESESRLPCDLCYACLDGSWNRDGDQRWGEPSDGEDSGDVDLLAELCVGRAPVDTAEEAATFVEKTLRYERGGHANPASVLVAAEYLGQFSANVHAQGGRMSAPLDSLFESLAVTWLDDRPHTRPQWGGADAMAALKRGPYIVLYNGHAKADAMMRLSTADLDALTNHDPFLLCSVGCHAGRFDNDPFSPDSIAEEAVKRSRYGAFAAVCNARLGWFDPRQEWRYSGELQRRFLEHALAQDRVGLGLACQRAKHDLLGQVEQRGTMPYRWCYYQVTLLGDPHLQLAPPSGPVASDGQLH